MPRCCSHTIRLLLIWSIPCLVISSVIVAAESAVSSQSDEKATSQQTPTAEWSTLKTRMTEIDEQVKALIEKFGTANDADKLKMRGQFQTLVQEFDQKVRPRMFELAAGIYKNDPKDFEAGEIVLQQTFQANQYENSLALAENLLKAGRRTPLVLNVIGVSQFALHQFTEAQHTLQQAEEEKMLIPQLGGRYLKASGEYIGYWEKEKEIRAKEAAATGDTLLPRVTLETTRGKIVVELFENEAPNTVANFVSLVQSKFYDGTKFHRIIPGFMAQGGDPTSRDGDLSQAGRGGPGYTIKCECYNENARKHFRGSLSMAHAGRDTGGSQFFLTHLPTPHLNQTPSPESVHTVFGRVIEGMDVVAALQPGDTITKATVLRKRNHEYKPETTPKP